MSVFDTLATPVAYVLREIHSGLSTVLPASSGWAWGLSIVFLTMTVRILLFPLFVKQIKSQRRMQELAPKIKDLQAKHKGDRESLNTELMKLYKDHGTNPISGCLPLILQLPIFFALFRVMNEFKPKGTDGHFNAKYGLSKELIEQGAHAKIFGAPISAAFNSSTRFLHQLGGDATTVKIVAVILIVTMGSTTFISQRQMMARNGAPTDPQQAQIQKIMLYVLPFSFAVFGFSFPVGVLLYWLTTNFWSMGQQAYVIKRMPPVVPGAGGRPGAAGKGGPGPGGAGPKGSPGQKATAGKSTRAPKASGGAAQELPAEAGQAAGVLTTGSTATKPQPARPQAGRSNARNAGSRKKKNRKGGRR